MDDILRKHEFEDEMKKMAVACIGLKPSTVRKKASKLFEKYSPIISYSIGDKEYYEIKARELTDEYTALKTGKISYVNQNGDSGVLLIKDIEQVDIMKKNISVTMRGGRIISLGLDFKYIINII